jgi:CheY-like chemotaxis protein
MAQRILVVDDEMAVRSLLRAMLERNGYDVTEAVDGDEAIREVEASEFDLIVTDLVMPSREGLETIRAIRSRYPSLPIIAISAPANRDYLRAAENFGAQRTFTKPFSLAAVSEAVRDLLAA